MVPKPVISTWCIRVPMVISKSAEKTLDFRQNGRIEGLDDFGHIGGRLVSMPAQFTIVAGID